jgi:hypothetical protein
MFVLPEDFAGPDFQIPNLNNEDGFLPYVDRMEKKFLVKIMGRNLQEAFYTGLKAGVEQRWQDLKDGKEYTYNGKPFKWEGMKKLFVPFIYQSWIGHTFNNLTGSGVVIPKIENGEQISPASRMIEAYNEATDYVGSECDPYNTLYGYLYTSESLFVDALGAGYTDVKGYLADVFANPGRENLWSI